VDRCKAIALPGKPAHDKAHAHNRPRLRADPITGPSAGRDSLRQHGAGQFHVAGPTGCTSPLSRRLRSAASSLAPRMAIAGHVGGRIVARARTTLAAADVEPEDADSRRPCRRSWPPAGQRQGQAGKQCRRRNMDGRSRRTGMQRKREPVSDG
jgi:hypothetical protein